MNNPRRKAIDFIAEQIENLKAGVEQIRDDEQDYYNNMPEGIQNGEKGDAAQSAIDELDSAMSCLEDAVTYLEDSKNQ